MALHESAEMYLETIYVLSRDSAAVRSIDVAEHMGYSKPSVSRAVSLLKQGGYLLVDANGSLTLTEEGKSVAKKMMRTRQPSSGPAYRWESLGEAGSASRKTPGAS